MKKIGMNSFVKSHIWLLLFGLLSCEKENVIALHLDTISADKYYSEEIISTEYKNIYGKWELYQVSGGFHGAGYEPDYDYLEIKNVGIYGLIRNDSLFEYGKIELAVFDNETTDFLQIGLRPDYYIGQNSYMSPPEKYIHLNGSDSLDFISPCCDMYNYHYKRVK